MDERSPMIPKDVELRPHPTASSGPPPRALPPGDGGAGGDDDASSRSSASSYRDESTNDLNVLSGAALITADCMGTGVLALPADMKVLGAAFGLTFLVLNLPINLYAGTILSGAATYVEERLGESPPAGTAADDDDGEEERAGAGGDAEGGDGRTKKGGTKKRSGYSSIETDGAGGDGGTPNCVAAEAEFDDEDADVDADGPSWEASSMDMDDGGVGHKHRHTVHRHTEVHTYDFIGMTSALFDHPHTSPDGTVTPRAYATKLVTAVFYTNIFLVLGNYILVMSHSVAAIVGEENICLPTAGAVASLLMYALSQIRTMANLGRSASAVSLTALFVVVVQCLASIERGERGAPGVGDDDDGGGGEDAEPPSLMRQLAALSSIGFAVGSQKLLLNIRHEMAERHRDTPRSLGVSLAAFGGAYVAVCALAGPDPPPLLFDAIGAGTGRRIAGLLLWVHVAVSFAINSQALTSSIDRIGFHRVELWGLRHRNRLRWALLTLLVAVSSYTVANAIPFFKDLVALIGALTSVPLTLLLPAVFHRRVTGVRVFRIGNQYDAGSYLLVMFALAFMVCGLVGVLNSIEMDWASKGAPFACH